jgi:hypothetical protein
VKRALGQLELGGLSEYCALKVAQLATWLYPKLVHKLGTGALECGQRVGLATRAVQRGH